MGNASQICDPLTWKGWGRENKKVRDQTEGGALKREALARSPARSEGGVDQSKAPGVQREPPASPATGTFDQSPRKRPSDRRPHPFPREAILLNLEA